MTFFQVKCDCDSLKLLAAAVDHSHTGLGAQMAAEAEEAARAEGRGGTGQKMFRKEFFDTAVCLEGEGEEQAEQSLKGFMRQRVIVEKGWFADLKKNHHL